MMHDAYVDARERLTVMDGQTLGNNVIALPRADRQRASLPVPVRQRLEGQVQLVAAILVGCATAVLVGAGPAASVGVLAIWSLVHLQTSGAALRPRLPGLGALGRQVVVPFAFIGLAVAVGLLPEAALAPSLLISLAATGALALTRLGLPSRRRPVRVLVVGDRPHLGHAVTTWASRRDITLVGATLFGDRQEHAGTDLDFETFGLPTGRGVDDLAQRVERLGAEAVVVLPSSGIGAADIRRLSWALEGTGATLAVTTELDGVAPHRVAVSSLAGSTLAEIAPSRPALHVRARKAVIDRVGAACRLGLLAPLRGVMVLMVRLESHGPGLFTQTRVGLNGRLFKVYKMRTMCVDAEERKQDLDDIDQGNGVLFKVREDPRITRVGRVLRKTSLDELPQLINVLKGEMSLVGPRPALPEEVAQYDEIARRRLAVRPGITGLWQVSGRSDLDWDTTVALDVRYTDNVTIGDDLRICLRTVRAVTSGRGAY
jgi:exopolysaccharide biosynthesis polyprenyl glycosylphosphotransferase